MTYRLRRTYLDTGSLLIHNLLTSILMHRPWRARIFWRDRFHRPARNASYYVNAIISIGPAGEYRIVAFCSDGCSCINHCLRWAIDLAIRGYNDLWDNTAVISDGFRFCPRGAYITSNLVVLFVLRSSCPIGVARDPCRTLAPTFGIVRFGALGDRYSDAFALIALAGVFVIGLRRFPLANCFAGSCF